MIGHRFQRRLLACQGVTVAIALIGACSDPTSPAGTSVSRPLMPLAVGTRWEYELYDSAGAGTVFTPVSTDTEAVVVAKDSIVAGEHFALLNGGADLLEEDGSSPVFVANRPDGLYEYRPPSGSVLLSTDAPILRFPYPTQRGAHFGLGGT